MAIRRPGPAVGAILGPGDWGVAGFKAYLSIQEDEESAHKALLLEFGTGPFPEDDCSDVSEKSL